MNPNPSACSSIASAPTSFARAANVVLQELAIACWNGILPEPQSRPSLSITPLGPLVSGSWYVAPPGTCESLSYCPLSIAAAAVTSLNVEPGGRVCWIARLSSGSLSVLLSRS